MEVFDVCYNSFNKVLTIITIISTIFLICKTNVFLLIEINIIFFFFIEIRFIFIVSNYIYNFYYNINNIISYFVFTQLIGRMLFFIIIFNLNISTLLLFISVGFIIFKYRLFPTHKYYFSISNSLNIQRLYLPFFILKILLLLIISYYINIFNNILYIRIFFFLRAITTIIVIVSNSYSFNTFLFLSYVPNIYSILFLMRRTVIFVNRFIINYFIYIFFLFILIKYFFFSKNS